MKMNKTWTAAAVAVVAVIAVVLLALLPSATSTRGRRVLPGASDQADEVSREIPSRPIAEESAAEETAAEDQPDEEEEQQVDEPQTEEEKLEAEEEKKVEDFDNLTDKWQESTKSGVSMKDIDEFAKTFRAVPKERQDECVHRALNLIPDENVMLLAGILMDKSMDKEIVEAVFNDILNRDEDVKLPIMREIFKDKTHPCWADVAWILDVTGEIKK